VVHVRKDGRQLRRTTIYMPVELATRVGVFAVTRGVDQTDVIREALEGYLTTRGA
jgi:predicted DNA-binding protein